MASTSVPSLDSRKGPKVLHNDAHLLLCLATMASSDVLHGRFWWEVYDKAGVEHRQVQAPQDGPLQHTGIFNTLLAAVTNSYLFVAI